MEVTTQEWSSTTDGGFDHKARLAIQCRLSSTQPVYADTAAGAVADTGIELLPGAIMELQVPRDPGAIYLATAEGTADVRVIQL